MHPVEMLKVVNDAGKGNINKSKLFEHMKSLKLTIMVRTVAAPIHVQKFLKGMNYPASKIDLINQAKKNKADNNVISILEGLKEDEFNSPAEVSKAIGEDS